jgi:hypothetical protein
MEYMRGRALRIVGACLVAATIAVVPYRGWAREYRDDAYESSRERGGYNDQYIFAATRGVNDMDAPAVLRATLFPVTILIDFVLLPAEIIGGFFG